MNFLVRAAQFNHDRGLLHERPDQHEQPQRAEDHDQDQAERSVDLGKEQIHGHDGRDCLPVHNGKKRSKGAQENKKDCADCHVVGRTLQGTETPQQNLAISLEKK